MSLHGRPRGSGDNLPRTVEVKPDPSPGASSGFGGIHLLWSVGLFLTAHKIGPFENH